MEERNSGIAGLLCGRRTKWVVCALWVLVVMVAGPLAGKLTDVQKNDTAQWLPTNAESTRVTALQKRFSTEETSPAIVVYERDSGVTAADEAKATADATALRDGAGVAGQVVGPLRAEDGRALQLVVPMRMGDDAFDTISDDVDRVRQTATAGADGLSVHVTGPAGYVAASASAFQGIDSTLLLATVSVVVVILLLTYRSPVLWLLPVLSAGVALVAAQAVIYLLARHGGLTVTSQSAGILTVLVFGAGTDYALLLVARYREELRHHADRHVAMRLALRRAAPAIVASAATVALGLLCLHFAEMNSTRGLGPVTAIGVVVGLLVMTTLLPALLVVVGRWVFWPRRPTVGSGDSASAGLWARFGARLARRPRVAWIATALVLGAMALGLTQLDTNGLSMADSFVTRNDAVRGEEAVARHFPAGQGQPVVVIGRAESAAQLQQAVSTVPGVTGWTPPTVREDLVALNGTLRSTADSEDAQRTVERVREVAHAVPGADAKVGGQTALTLDMNRANTHDNRLIIPLVLGVVLLILVLLLRALVAPLVLIATVVLSFAAALGLSAVVFRHLLDFGGADTAFPLFVFVFLVTLGVDYNIFLMTRVREEAARHGTRQGALIGLATTGGVITSAGLVLAATFAVFGAMPLVSFAEMGIAVALGVLLETLVVRSVMVTALTLDLGHRMWWPGPLSRQTDDAAGRQSRETELATP